MASKYNPADFNFPVFQVSYEGINRILVQREEVEWLALAGNKTTSVRYYYLERNPAGAIFREQLKVHGMRPVFESLPEAQAAWEKMLAQMISDAQKKIDEVTNKLVNGARYTEQDVVKKHWGCRE